MKETSELTYERRPAESQCPGGKVALIYTSFAPFVARDHDLLSKHLDVENVSFAGMRDAPRILSAVKRSDVAISWFAGGHAALAVAFSRLLDRGSIVIVGGYDVARVPEIDYGQFSMGWRQRAQARMALAWADKVLVVDPSLKEDAIKNAGVDGRNIEYLPTGYDPARFRPGGKKEDLAIIVGTNMSETVIKRKGLATFVKAASYLPEVQFAVIGRPKDGSVERLKRIAPSNVKFTGYLSDDDLLRCYQRAKVYCQISLYEGLPNALCEAMLCGCIPVGTERNGIPNAIGDTGFYVPYGDPEATADAISKALEAPESLGDRARERIMRLFPVKRREAGLLEAVEEVRGYHRRAPA